MHDLRRGCGAPATRRTTARTDVEQAQRRPAAPRRVPSTVKRRGEAPARLIDAARTTFNDRGYERATTREIAQRANLSETTLFRHYHSKAELFHVAMIEPFVVFVQNFAARGRAGEFHCEGARAETRKFLSGIYDVFAAHRGVVAMLWASDVHVESELAESGLLAIVREQFDTLAALFGEQIRRRGMSLPNDELTIGVTLAMVSCMATFGRCFYGASRPTRDAVIDEITDMVIHGHVRRD